MKVYYDRRNVNATEIQFFHESRAKHSDKEIGTNMERDAQFPTAGRIKKVALLLPATLLSSATARDATLDDQVRIFCDEAIIQLQCGDKPVHYLPAVACLAPVSISGALAYSLATAADGSYGIMSVNAGNGAWGCEVDIEYSENETLKAYVKTKSTPALGTVTAMLWFEPA